MEKVLLADEREDENMLYGFYPEGNSFFIYESAACKLNHHDVIWLQV